MKRYVLLAIGVAAVFLSACTPETNFPKAKGEGTVRFLNAIQTSPEIAFLIEERRSGLADYKTTSATVTYDGLEYTFNFQTLILGATARIASQILVVEDNKDYTFVLTGALAAPDVTIWEGDGREWAGTETVFEAHMANAAATLGDIDIYFADPAIPPVLGSQIATLAFTEDAAPVDLEAGDYVLTITPAGDDTTILFTSNVVSLAAQSQLLISVFDGDANDLTPIAVRLFNLDSGGAVSFADSRVPPTMRFIHAAMTMGDADIYIDDPLTTPVVTDHMFRDFTLFIDVTTGDLPITYTPPGNIGTTLVDVDYFVFPGTRSDFFVLTNILGEYIAVANRSDRRSIETMARVSFMNTAGGRVAVDIYVVPSGESIDEAPPYLFALPLGIAPRQLPFLPGSYDVYVTDVDEKIPLAGPIPMILNFGDVLETIIFENVDPNVVDFEFMPPP